MLCHKFSGLTLHLEEMRESAKANLVLFLQTVYGLAARKEVKF